MTERVLAITGIGGFIGGRVAALAREAGWTVRGLELDPGAAAAARRAGAEVVLGDVRDARAASEAVRGASAVVHTAAVVRESGPRALLQGVNVDGTEVVAAAARAAGAGHLVHLSSVMVYGFHFADGADESAPLRGEDNPYCETKIESELAAMSFDDPSGLGVTVLRPGDVYGPGSVPWVVRPLGLARRRLLAVPSRRAFMNPLYVDNLADAILTVIEQRAVGRTYNVTDDEPTTFYDYFGRLATWVHARVRVLPATVMRGVAAAASVVGLATGRPALASPAAVRFLQRPGRYSIERICTELSWRPRRTLADGLAETEVWARHAGLLET